MTTTDTYIFLSFSVVQCSFQYHSFLQKSADQVKTVNSVDCWSQRFSCLSSFLPFSPKLLFLYPFSPCFHLSVFFLSFCCCCFVFIFPFISLLLSSRLLLGVFHIFELLGFLKHRGTWASVRISGCLSQRFTFIYLRLHS